MIRLACMECDRQDFDGIEDLQKAIAEGWKDIGVVQTHAEACTTYEDTGDEPATFSVLDWWTHLGWCPDCTNE